MQFHRRDVEVLEELPHLRNVVQREDELAANVCKPFGQAVEVSLVKVEAIELSSPCSGGILQSNLQVGRQHGSLPTFPFDFHLEVQENSTVYKIDYSDVAVKPEVAFNLLKILVGERGFEPPTPWSRTGF